MYLDALDQFIKHELEVRYYARYCDDMVLLSADRSELETWEKQIGRFLEDRLRLRLNDRRKLRPISDGIDFLGYIIRPDYLLVRRRVVGALRNRLERAEWALRRQGMRRGHRREVFPWPWTLLEQVRQWLGSYLAHLDRASSGGLLRSLQCRFAWLDEYFVWTGTGVRFRCPVPRGSVRFAEQKRWFLDRLPGHVLLVQEGPFCETITDGVSGQVSGDSALAAVEALPRRFPRRRLRSLARLLWRSDLAVAWIAETGRRPGNIAERALVLRWGVSEVKGENGTTEVR